MKPLSKFFVAFALCLLMASRPALAQGYVQQYERQMRVLPVAASLVEDTEHLGDTLLRGRGVGSAGAVEASWWALRRMQSAGLSPYTSSFKAGDAVGHNVVAVHRGGSSKAPYTLIMAHFDGIGVLSGEIIPGADANASGVAMLLYLADSLAASRANYIFAAVDAHHASMAGAAALYKELSGKYKLGLVVNLDTIGSTLAPPNPYRPDFLIALGAKKFEQSLDRANTRPDLKIYYDYYGSKAFTDYFYRRASDQAPFLDAGIPCIMFTSGITLSTNKPTDTASTLNYPVFTRRAVLILEWLKSRN